jgi:hypothetical protein
MRLQSALESAERRLDSLFGGRRIGDRRRGSGSRGDHGLRRTRRRDTRLWVRGQIKQEGSPVLPDQSGAGAVDDDVEQLRNRVVLEPRDQTHWRSSFADDGECSAGLQDHLIELDSFAQSFDNGENRVGLRQLQGRIRDFSLVAPAIADMAQAESVLDSVANASR